MPLITIDGSETPAENVGKSIPRDKIGTLDTFTKERRIWPGSTVHLESFLNTKGKAARIFYGEATEALSVNLDPGWYRYKCTSTDEYGETHQFVNQFFVQCTYDMFRLYAAMKPKYSKGRQTSSGVRWTCGFSNCKRSFTGMFAMIDHEKRHEGETIFSRIPWKPDGVAGAYTSQGIVILGGMPEGAMDPPPRKAVLPPIALMQEIEAENVPVEEPKKKGWPKGKPRGKKAQAETVETHA